MTPEQYLSREVAEWPEDWPLWSESYSKFFDDLGEVYEWMQEAEISDVAELQLFLCRPLQVLESRPDLEELRSGIEEIKADDEKLADFWGPPCESSE